MGMSLDGFSGDLSSYANVYNTSSTTGTDLASELKSKDYSKVTEEDLMEACRSFEQYFVEQMYKSMEKMIPESESEDSFASSYKDMFGDKLTEEYAKLASNSNDGKGLGIAQMLYEQMKRNYGFE